MRITAKGQVTIPIEVRDKLGLVHGSEVEFKVEGNSGRLTKIPAKRARSRYIGAHAAVADLRLLTRDATRYRTYFPTVEVISPP